MKIPEFLTNNPPPDSSSESPTPPPAPAPVLSVSLEGPTPRVGRPAIPGVVSRTFRVHKETYEAILEYFRRSPTGMTGGEAIRLILYEFGKLCAKRLSHGKVAQIEQINEIKEFVQSKFEETK